MVGEEEELIMSKFVILKVFQTACFNRQGTWCLFFFNIKFVRGIKKKYFGNIKE